MYKAIEYEEQVVAGTNYRIKVKFLLNQISFIVFNNLNKTFTVITIFNITFRDHLSTVVSIFF